MANGKQAAVTTAHVRTVATEGELLQLLVDNVTDSAITILDPRAMWSRGAAPRSG
jgi:hypothetical protein